MKSSEIMEAEELKALLDWLWDGRSRERGYDGLPSNWDDIFTDEDVDYVFEPPHGHIDCMRLACWGNDHKFCAGHEPLLNKTYLYPEDRPDFQEES